MLCGTENGAIVHQFVGYDRYEGDRAYRQLIELYRALRLYVNFFQPSLKLKEKHQDGTTTKRTYRVAQTPFERLCAVDVLSSDARSRLDAIFAALDPVRLLAQIGQLQEALWAHAVLPSATIPEEAIAALRFTLDPNGADAAPEPAPIQRQKRSYRRKNAQLPRWWRTHPDPFAEIWSEVEGWLEAQPGLTGVAVFKRLQQEHPNVFPDGQLRTLQRRVAKWRTSMITTFDDQWLQGEVLAGADLPLPLRATSHPGPMNTGAEESTLAAGQAEQSGCSAAR
jgi:hypothetical protein